MHACPLPPQPRPTPLTPPHLSLCYCCCCSYFVMQQDFCGVFASNIVLVHNSRWGRHAAVAQSVERKALNLVVVGSSPTGGGIPFLLFHLPTHNPQATKTNTNATQKQCCTRNTNTTTQHMCYVVWLLCWLPLPSPPPLLLGCGFGVWPFVLGQRANIKS